MSGPACFGIRVSPDGMEAWADFVQAPPAGWDPGEVARALADQGIVHGILREALRGEIPRASAGAAILVAAGDRPLEGAPARVERLVGASPAERRLDGSVDPHEGRVQRVRRGQRVLRHVGPRPGMDGRDVYGRTVPAARQPDCPFAAGPGLARDPDYAEFMIAASDGVLVEAEGRHEVRPELAVAGDIGPGTGDVDFPGQVTVKGSILAGFRVRVGGGLRVGGSVEEAEVRVQGDLAVAQGILGGSKGSVAASGNVAARHAENARVDADGDIAIEKGALNCTLTAGGAVRVRGSLVSGTVVAGRVIEAGEAGSPGGAPLWLRVGWPLATCRELQRIAAERASLQQRLGEPGHRHDTPGEVEALRSALRALAERERALTEGESEPGAHVAVQRTIHDGVRISIGADSLRVEGELRGPVRLDAANLRRIQRPVALWVSAGLLARLQKDFEGLGFLNRIPPPARGAEEPGWPPEDGILCLEPTCAGEAGAGRLRQAGRSPRRKVVVFATKDPGEDRDLLQGLWADAWIEAPGGKPGRDWAEDGRFRALL